MAFECNSQISTYPDNKVDGANMGPTWGRQGPGGPHVCPMNLAICVVALTDKQLEMYGCILSTILLLMPWYYALVLKHQAISIHSAD